MDCWQNVGRTLVEHWQNIGRTLIEHWKNVGEHWRTLENILQNSNSFRRKVQMTPKKVECWQNVGRTLVECWQNVGRTLVDFGRTLVEYWWNVGRTLVECWSKVGRTLVEYWRMLVERWSNVGKMLENVGKRSPKLKFFQKEGIDGTKKFSQGLEDFLKFLLEQEMICPIQ